MSGTGPDVDAFLLDGPGSWSFSTSIVERMLGLFGSVAELVNPSSRADGAVHGGLATVIGGLILLVFLTVFGVLFVGLVPASGGATIALLALFAQAVPGALASAVGG